MRVKSHYLLKKRHLELLVGVSINGLDVEHLGCRELRESRDVHAAGERCNLRCESSVWCQEELASPQKEIPA